MKIIHAAIVCTVLLAMVGCARSSVVPIGEDTYILNRAQKGFTTTAVREEALQEARAYCEAQGMLTEILGVDVQNMVVYTSDPEATVSFKCIETDEDRE